MRSSIAATAWRIKSSRRARTSAVVTAAAHAPPSASPSQRAPSRTTGAGDIDLTVLRDIAGKGDIDLSTGHGDVTVTLPADFSMDVDIDLGVTKSAGSDPSIRSDFPLQIDESKDWDYSMGSPRRHIRASGKPGGGLHRLKIRATNGNIILRRAQS